MSLCQTGIGYIHVYPCALLNITTVNELAKVFWTVKTRFYSIIQCNQYICLSIKELWELVARKRTNTSLNEMQDVVLFTVLVVHKVNVIYVSMSINELIVFLLEIKVIQEIFLVLKDYWLYVVYIWKQEFGSCAMSFQWCSIFHCHWLTASIKPRLLFLPCRLYFLVTSLFQIMFKKRLSSVI